MPSLVINWKLLPKDGKNPARRLGFRAPPSDTVAIDVNWSKSGVTGSSPRSRRPANRSAVVAIDRQNPGRVARADHPLVGDTADGAAATERTRGGHHDRCRDRPVDDQRSAVNRCRAGVEVGALSVVVPASALGQAVRSGENCADRAALGLNGVRAGQHAVVPVMLPLVSVTVATVSLNVPMASVAPLRLRLVLSLMRLLPPSVKVPASNFTCRCRRSGRSRRW